MPSIEIDARNVYEQIKSGQVSLTTREAWRGMKNLTHREFDEYIARVGMEFYRDGIKDAESAINELKAQSDDENVGVDFDRVLEVIGQVKGIGEKRLAEIERKCTEVFG